jgi:hypothetical protein
MKYLWGECTVLQTLIVFCTDHNAFPVDIRGLNVQHIAISSPGYPGFDD